MKRQIKFRGKWVNGGEWVESMTISHGTIKRKSYNIFFETGENVWVGVIPETVGQFTGITLNNKDVYEHDLIDCFGVLCEVVYNEGIAAFVLLELHSNTRGVRPIGEMFGLFECEVIGNIHDNPELIEETR